MGSLSWLSVIPTANLEAISLQCLLATDFSSVEINSRQEVNTLDKLVVVHELELAVKHVL